MKHAVKALLITAFLTLLQTPAMAQTSSRPIDVLRDAILLSATKGGDVTMIRRGEMASKSTFKPPVRITYVAKTNGNDLRIAYAANQIILNWKDNPQELRIDGGPADGRHVAGGGKIPKSTFVTIVQEVTPTQMTISVDGIRRAIWNADFSKVDEQIRVFPNESTVTVHSLTVEPLRRAEK